MWTHLHWAGVNRISRLSPAWKFQLYFTRITDVSPAFCNCQVKHIVPSPPPEKTETKLYLRRKRRLGKPLCISEALSIWQHYVWRQSTFTVFLCLSIISSLCIVYNRGARLTLACFDNPSWWQHLVNENVACSMYARALRKMKRTRVGAHFFSKNPKQKKHPSNYFWKTHLIS